MKTVRLILFLSLTILLAGCGIFKKSKDTHREANRASKENFDDFYDRFHKDETFQMSRIQFPLEGIKIDGMNEEAWSRDNWNTMKVKIYDVDTDQFEVDYEKTEDTFTQKFKMKNAEFYAIYRFEKRKGKWYLVYAKDVNL